MSEKRKSGQRSRKRQFHGNRYSSGCQPVVDTSSNVSASAKKLKLDDIPEKSYVTQGATLSGYRLVDVQRVFEEIQTNLCCRICGGCVQIQETLVHGLSSKFSIDCATCGVLTSFRNSRMCGKQGNVAEINRRSIYAMRCIGQGFAGLQTFCQVMDLPPPLSRKCYEEHLEQIRDALQSVAESSMMKAAEDEKNLTDSNLPGIVVSGDGTWKTRGHTSLIGVATIVGAESGKAIDVEVLSAFCKGCSEWKGKTHGPDFEEWKEKHAVKCTKNHCGSSGKMEVDGMVNMFRRSEPTRGTRYVQYIGDGDSQTFLAIKKAEPYGNCPIEKLECVCHVKKRMGTRLRKLKKESHGRKLSDGKPLGGKGRLTDKLIDKFSSYYGKAIMENSNSVEDMRKAVWAIYCHSRSTDAESLHMFCPKSKESWCKYQQAVSEGKEKEFHHDNAVPSAVMDEVKKIFKDLSSPDLLKRCLQGRTQNPNESLNALIWKFCPKTSGSGLLAAQIATYEAVVAFNEGARGRLETMRKLECPPGMHSVQAAVSADFARLKNAERMASQCTLASRKLKRSKKLQKNRRDEKREGVVYGPGLF